MLGRLFKIASRLSSMTDALFPFGGDDCATFIDAETRSGDGRIYTGQRPDMHRTRTEWGESYHP
jgi:hypothetical protein